MPPRSGGKLRCPGNGGKLSGAQFTGDARFDEAQFTHSACFDLDLLIGGVKYGGAQFTSNASFRQARFASDTRFARTKFARNANFFGAWFSRGVPAEIAAYLQHTPAGEATAGGSKPNAH